MAIRKRNWTTKSGVQTAWMADYYDAEGQRHRQQFGSYGEAKRWLRRAEAEVQEGTHTPDSKTARIGEACQAWIERAEREKLETATIRQYENHVGLHICPEKGGFMVGKERFAEIKLSRLTKPTVEKFRDHLIEHNNRTMAQKVLTSFKAIVKEAKRKGWINSLAAVEDVKISLKKREQRPIRVGDDIPTREEMQRIIAKAIDPWRPIFVVAAFTGLRSSELRGLIWEHVQLDRSNPVIEVVQRADEKNQLGPCKSKAAYRTIPLAPIVVETLKAWREVCPRLVDATTGERRLWLVFPNGAGKVENHSNIENRGLYATQERAGVTVPCLDDDGQPTFDADGKTVMSAKYSMHALRHFFASWLIERSFNLKRVQYLMGHESVQLTLDTYTHLFHDDDDHAKFADGQAWVMGEAKLAGEAAERARPLDVNPDMAEAAD
jgi:integrase